LKEKTVYGSELALKEVVTPMQRCVLHGNEITSSGCWECQRDAQRAQDREQDERNRQFFREQREHEEREREQEQARAREYANQQALHEAAEASARAMRAAQIAAEERQRNGPRLLAEGESARAKACLEVDDIEGGLRHAQRAVDADATYAMGRALLAVLLYRVGDGQGAEREAARAFRLDPNAVAGMLADFHAPSHELVQFKAQERAAAEAREQAAVLERQRAQEQALLARQAVERAEAVRHAEQERAIMLEQWLHWARKLSWESLFTSCALSLVWTVGVLFLLTTWAWLPVHALGLVLVGFIVPALASERVGRAWARVLRIDPGPPAERMALVLRIVGATGVAFVLVYMASALGWRAGYLRCRQGWLLDRTTGNYEALVYVALATPLIASALTWGFWWPPVLRSVRASEGVPEDFDARRAARAKILNRWLVGAIGVAALLLALMHPAVGPSELHRMHSWDDSPYARAGEVSRALQRADLARTCWREEIAAHPSSGERVVDVTMGWRLDVDDNRRVSGHVSVQRWGRSSDGTLSSLNFDPAIDERASRCVLTQAERLRASLPEGEAICGLENSHYNPPSARSPVAVPWRRWGSANDLATTEQSVRAGALVKIDTNWERRDPNALVGFDVLVENGAFENPTRQRFRWRPEGSKTFVYVVPMAGRITILIPPDNLANARWYPRGESLEAVRAWVGDWTTAELDPPGYGRELRVSVFSELPAPHETPQSPQPVR
jgi:tetratricopeptide (TPR) repeat protein